MYTILTDSCTDFSPEITGRFEKLVVLPMNYTMKGETKAQAIGDADAVRELYAALRAGENCTTSQISPNTFQEAFTPFAKEGEPLLCIIFSSALSGTYNAACIAKEMVLEEYPDAVIEVVDSLSASAGQGLMVYDALLNREAGMSLEENAAWIRAHVQNYVQWFTVDDLNFLKRGGRCSPSSAFFGSLLSIKPVLGISEEGKLIARQKVRGRNQALKALVSKFGELSDGSDHAVFISHADCEEDANFVKTQLVEQYGCKPENVVLSFVGPVIGSHSGPGTVALFFWGKERG